MSVLVYADQKYRTLAGNKIFDGSKWVTMGGDSKIFLDGKWHAFSWKKAELPDVPSDPEIPSWDDFTHLATEEPTEGNVYYMTPTGAGQMDGSSWDNAWSASQIHIAMLTITEGSRLYMAEGDYGTLDRPITADFGFSLYGGFVDGDYSWTTRDAFKHPTLWKGDGTFAFINSSGVITLDGICISDFGLTIADIVFVNVTSYNSSFNEAIKSSIEYITSSLNCRFSGIGGVGCYNVTGCYFKGSADSPLRLYRRSGYPKMTRSVIVDCEINDEADNISGGYLSECVVHNIYVHKYSGQSFFVNNVSNTTLTECRIGSIKTVTECTIIDSTIGQLQNATDSSFLRASGSITAANTDFADCLGIRIVATDNCIIRNCDHIYEANNSLIFKCVGYITSPGYTWSGCDIINSQITGSYRPLFNECRIVNSVINGVGISNSSSGNPSSRLVILNSTVGAIDKLTTSLIVNCALGTTSSVSGATIVNSTATVSSGSSCVFWNNNGTIPGETNAQTVFDSKNALTLGDDNSIARFVNTGYYPAIGVQDVGECPDPLNDPDGFSAYVSIFGDWHPRSDSFLVGKGVYDSASSTDLDGVTRPDPPTIGAYEPRPE